MRTSDLRHWEELPPPPHTFHCHAMVSHHGHLVFLSRPSVEQDPQKHPVLFRMNGATRESPEQDHQASLGISWEKLPNGRTPTQQWLPALFGEGDSLVMVGGRCADTGSLDIVQEYCLSTGHWLEPTDWPNLPERCEAQYPVTMGNAIHLFGGGIFDNKTFTGGATVVTMEVDNGRHGPAWKTDAIQPSPHVSSGASRLFNTVAVAGGFRSGREQSKVNVWDTRSQQWLGLPDLTIVRDQTLLVYFKGNLLAIGGFNKPGHWISSVEQFSISSVLGISE